MKNVKPVERVVRAVVGVGILSAGYYYHNYWGLMGLIPLLTGLVGWCPLYSFKCAYSSEDKQCHRKV